MMCYFSSGREVITRKLFKGPSWNRGIVNQYMMAIAGLLIVYVIKLIEFMFKRIVFDDIYL